MVSRTAKSYDAIAGEYYRRWGGRVLDGAMDRFCAYLPDDAVVVDVGCGPGMDVALLCARGPNAFGIDLSEAMLNLAQREFGVNCAQADMRLLPFRSNVDGLWACASLLHLPAAEARRTLEGFARALAPAGVLFLAVKGGSGEFWDEAYGHDAPRFVKLWEASDLDRVLAAAGFCVVEAWREEAGTHPWLNRLALLNI